VNATDVAGPPVVISAREARNIARLLAGVASFYDHGPNLAAQALARHLHRYGVGEAPNPNTADEGGPRFRALLDVYRHSLDCRHLGQPRP
jgi:hypothetical protein